MSRTDQSHKDSDSEDGFWREEWARVREQHRSQRDAVAAGRLPFQSDSAACHDVREGAAEWFRETARRVAWLSRGGPGCAWVRPSARRLSSAPSPPFPESSHDLQALSPTLPANGVVTRLACGRRADRIRPLTAPGRTSKNQQTVTGEGSALGFASR